ncbi:MAG: DUF6291 domain-containing protein [Sediminibacterium sp.]
MKEKKGILVYADWIHVFESLKDAEAGRLIKHFFRYVNDQNPEPPDKITKIVFEPIKQTLKRDLVKWEGKKIKYSIAGKASAEKRSEIKKSSTFVENVQHPSTNSTVSVNDSVSVSATVSVSDNVNVNDYEERAREYISSSPSAKDFFKIELLKTEFVQDEIWIADVCKEFSIEKEKIFSALEDFNTELARRKDTLKTRKDYATHFRNLFRTSKGKINGNNNQRINQRGTATTAAVIQSGKEFGIFR